MPAWLPILAFLLVSFAAYLLILALAPEQAVDEQQCRAAAAVAVGEGVPVQGHRVLGGRRVHDGS